MHNISILRSGSQSLCKRFSLEEGVVKSQRASMPAFFTFESQTVDGIEDFARLLTDLGRDRGRFIVRGHLAEDVDIDKPMRRRLWLKDRSEPKRKGVRPLKSKSQLRTELAFLCAQANYRTSKIFRQGNDT